MELTDQRDIAADPQTVWNALTDADVLRRCIPGCQEMSGSPDEGYTTKVVQKVGPVKATFNGRVELSDVVEGQSCRMSGEGKGGAAGFAKGAADVALAPIEGGTRLSYDVTAKVGGKLAQLGGRVIDGFAKKMADQFFDNFKRAVEGDDEGPIPQSATTEGDARTVTESPAPEPNAGPAPDGAATPASGAGETSARPTGPDEDQSGERQKNWFQRMVSN